MRSDPTPQNPHPLVIFGGSSSIAVAERVAAYCGEKLGEAENKPFANGECMVKVETNVRGRDVFVIQSVCRKWNSSATNPYTGINDSLMELLIWGDTLSLASAHRVTAVIPYFGYARQDRKTESRTPITAKLVCDLIEQAGFDRVLTIDLHCEQIQGFFHRKGCKLDLLNAGQLFEKHFGGIKNAVILSPDIGNLKKIKKFRRGLPQDVGIAIVDKTRDPKSREVEVERLTGDSVKGKIVIIPDDIIATAGTIEGAVKIAMQNGALECRIWATHGEFVGNAISRLQNPHITEINVTDTIPVLPEAKEKLPIRNHSTSELLGEAINRIHKSKSISSLLGDYG